MRILFLTSPAEDYLADSMLHGLRSLYGGECVDFPKSEVLYCNNSARISTQIRGGGFTLYGLLEDMPVDRFNIDQKVKNGFFDLIVISNLWRQFGWFVQYRPWLNWYNCIILDGEDTPQAYPAAGRWWRRPYYWFLPRAHPHFLYFKREWTADTHFNLWHRLLPPSLRKVLPWTRNLRPISFSIPEEKIVRQLPTKAKLFTRHIVDPEVAARVPGSRTTYAFSTEPEYYADLQVSKFGITTKRAGWDCLRHYEIAANGCVPCFRDLHLKPETCAPQGLQPGVNCLSYRNADDLFGQIEKLCSGYYLRLEEGALAWARANTTIAAASNVLAKIESFT